LIYRELGIDVSKLSAMEQLAAKRKVRRFYIARLENAKIEQRLLRLEMIQAGTPGLPPHTLILLKLYNDETKETKILKVSSDDSADDLTALANRTIGTSSLLNVQTSPDTIAPLCPEELIEAHTSICKREQTSLVIVAL
jgi:predicted transcriptional regulator